MTELLKDGLSGTSPDTLSAGSKVLLIDDHQELLSVVGEILQENGLTVLIARSAEEGLSVLTHNTPEVIICDIMMPGMDGFNFQEIVLNNPDWCHVPFVFLTALPSSAEVRQGREHGCDEYITKPFNPLDLVSVIKGKLLLASKRQKMSQSKIDQYRRRIVQTLSHEFRTPLVAINTGAEFLMDQHSMMDAARVKQLLQSIQRGGLRLQRLVDDFMTLQQIESGQADRTCQRLRRQHHFKQIIQVAIELFRDGGMEVKHHICFDPSGIPDYVVDVCDIQIMDVLQRLLSNANRFNTDSQPVHVFLKQLPDTVACCVRDFGPGLPLEVRASALEMFQQINRDKFEQQGCGLGLTIASYFTELNGGHLEFSEPVDGGNGLVIELHFPRLSL